MANILALFAIFCSSIAMLLVFNNAFTYIPISMEHRQINRMICLLQTIFNDLAYIGKKGVERL